MHPRLLIVGTVPYNRQTTARAFESYFSKWEKENLAQIFSNPREPVHGHCNTFYQITDKMMLQRHFRKSTTVGKIYYDKDLNDEWEPQTITEKKTLISKLYNLGSRKFPLNYLLRGLLWKRRFWCTNQLNQWLDEFKPECVFLAFSDDYFIPQIALYVAKKYDVPIISCIGDDYYFNDKFSISPFYYLYRKTYKKLVNNVFLHGGSAAYIGDKIRDKYNSEFGLDGETVYLTSEIKRHNFVPINIDNPLIVYCGNIRLGRNYSICAIANALGRMNPKYKIDVYSNESDQKYYKMLEDNPNIEFHGAVPYSQVVKIMECSDVLIIVEGFSKKDVSITRYSLSTKVADSLAVGGSVLTLGSIECGAIEYMKNIECGPVCTSIEQLDQSLNRLFFDVEYQKANYEKAIQITEQHHSLECSNAVFETLVEKAISVYHLRKQITYESS